MTRGTVRQGIWRREIAYLCISPAADPIDRHSRMSMEKMPMDSRTRGLLSMCQTCRDGGSRDLAAFHEYPLPTSMLKRGRPAALFSSSRLCDTRTDKLLARIPAALFDSRCVWSGVDSGEASLVVGMGCEGCECRSYDVASRQIRVAARESPDVLASRKD